MNGNGKSGLTLCKEKEVGILFVNTIPEDFPSY